MIRVKSTKPDLLKRLRSMLRKMYAVDFITDQRALAQRTFVVYLNAPSVTRGNTNHPLDQSIRLDRAPCGCYRLNTPDGTYYNHSVLHMRNLIVRLCEGQYKDRFESFKWIPEKRSV